MLKKLNANDQQGACGEMKSGFMLMTESGRD
ncbi:hypothetical protein [Arsenophonus endosymbiont of Aleurodicus floccissimus]